MSRRTRPNIPVKLHGNDREVLGFLQALLDYSESIVQIGMSVKWGSTSLPNSNYLAKTGQVVNRADYPELWSYAQNDAAYVTTATTVTIPVDAGFIVKVR